MKRRFIGITSLLFAGAFISGCSNLLDDGTVKVLSNDVKAETQLQESELKVMKNDSLSITETVDYNGLVHGSLFYNENGATFRLNPFTNEIEKVANIEFYDISQQGNKALAKNGQTFFVLDLNTGTTIEIGTGGDEYEYYFADADGEEVIYVEDKLDANREIHLINSETAERTTWKIDDTFESNGFMINSVKKGKEGLYTVLKKKEGKIGLYELRLDGEIKLVNELKDFEHLSTFDFLTDDKIIFNEIYNGVSGIYTLDLVTSEIVQLVAGGEDDEGIWVPFYLLSPDKSKMLFDVPVQVGKEYKTNVYVGELIGDKLINISTVMTAADLYAVIPLSAVWSNDSQEVYIATNQEQKNTIQTIEVFQITK